MIDLTQTTFIIPIQVESSDRYNNARVVLGYLNHHFNTNVFIYEKNDEYKSKLDFLDSFKNLTITYFLEKNNDDFFHRTKFLNNMLRNVKTPVVCNYDIDVILEPKVYEKAQEFLLTDSVDVIYPYGIGYFQYKIHKQIRKEGFSKTYNIDYILNNPNIERSLSICGHCIFFKTSIYKKFGGENQGFVGYAPEDAERFHRFMKLSKVGRFQNEFVFHWEHSRNEHSSDSNPYFPKNQELHDYLVSLSKEELIEYYSSKIIY